LCGASQNQPCNSATFTTDDGMGEVALDIDMVAALAPGVSQILVYEGPNSEQGIFDIYSQMASDNKAKAISTSWAIDEVGAGSSFENAEAQVFQKMATQGQTVYAAAGDDGAYDNGGNTVLGLEDPSSQPYVTGVGGTSLSGTIQNPAETVWNDGFDSGENRYDATGGGVSAVWSIPNYQAGVSGVFSQSNRNVPDVALNADPASGYAVFVGGSFFAGRYGGTSAAAPLWAAFTALLNQQSVANGNTTLGFANPVLYQQATSSAYSSLFNDVTSGNNGFYSAHAGYDNTTGWGSFKGLALINSSSGELAVLTLNNLTNVYAYPNPWDVRKNPPSVVTLANVPTAATIKIFTISGFLVKDLSATGAHNTATWDLTNNAGQSVASGLYFYLVKMSDQTLVHGKIAVIR
jgi:kumamolisin